MPARVAPPSLINGRQRRTSSTLLCLLSISAPLTVFLWNRNPPQEKAQEPTVFVGEFDTVNLPVPSEPVPAGTRVRDIQFKTVAYPKQQLPPGALTSLEHLENSLTASPLPASVPLFPENFASSGSLRNPIIERIPQGMRAMTIKVDATSAVEGWAGSGARVDVLLVTPERTTVVAEDVKILSAERSVSPVEGTSAPNVPNTVTLLVTQEQCLAINTAVPLGRIAFALRSNEDDATWKEPSFKPEYLKAPRQESQQVNISGYVSVDRGKNAFALSNGKWVATEQIPSGFLPSQER